MQSFPSYFFVCTGTQSRPRIIIIICVYERLFTTIKKIKRRPILRTRVCVPKRAQDRRQPLVAEIVQPDYDDDDGPCEIGFLVPDRISYYYRDVYITIYYYIVNFDCCGGDPLPAGCSGDSSDFIVVSLFRATDFFKLILKKPTVEQYLDKSR